MFTLYITLSTYFLFLKVPPAFISFKSHNNRVHFCFYFLFSYRTKHIHTQNSTTKNQVFFFFFFNLWLLQSKITTQSSYEAVILKLPFSTSKLLKHLNSFFVCLFLFLQIQSSHVNCLLSLSYFSFSLG